jgi:hypothetical protein
VHAYPAQLADFVLDHWPQESRCQISRRMLAELLSTCFQASLFQEEGRTVRFRLLAASPTELAQVAGDESLLHIEFTEAQLLTADAVRRLSPAAPFHASSIGATLRGDRWELWGLSHTGPRWLGPSWDARAEYLPRMPFLMVHVLGPGRLAVYAGSELVATLERGMIEASTTDVFSSAWLGELFRDARSELAPATTAPGAPARIGTANDLVRLVSQHMVRRSIFLIRSAGHGGLLLVAEPELISACRASQNGPLKLKYAFRPGDASRRYRTLVERLVLTLFEQHGNDPLDVAHFLKSELREVSEIERGIFEFSRLVSGLAAVDGAVVMNKRFELIGFGAEVSGELPYPDIVWQALDVEAERRSEEPANSVGTRHRAAYRFVTAHAAGLAIVISHDGAVRFVARRGDDVVYWDQFLSW